MKRLNIMLFVLLFSTSMGFAQHNISTTTRGSNNSTTVNQSGSKGMNNTNIQQFADGNSADITQKGDHAGSGPLGSKYTNSVYLVQANGSKATVSQTGRDYVGLKQFGGSVAEINQDYGDHQIVRGIFSRSAVQTGGSKLFVHQQGTKELGSSGARRLGSELRIAQLSTGFAGLGLDEGQGPLTTQENSPERRGSQGHVADIWQRDGAFAGVLQASLVQGHKLIIKQDGDSEIYLGQIALVKNSVAKIKQKGDGNLVSGESGFASQTGFGGHTLDIDQKSPFGGSGNTANISQMRRNQHAVLTQHGMGNMATINQN